MPNQCLTLRLRFSKERRRCAIIYIYMQYVIGPDLLLFRYFCVPHTTFSTIVIPSSVSSLSRKSLHVCVDKARSMPFRTFKRISKTDLLVVRRVNTRLGEHTLQDKLHCHATRHANESSLPKFSVHCADTRARRTPNSPWRMVLLFDHHTPPMSK